MIVKTKNRNSNVLENYKKETFKTVILKNYFLNFNTAERPFLKILLLTTLPLRKAFCS